MANANKKENRLYCVNWILLGIFEFSFNHLVLFLT